MIMGRLRSPAGVIPTRKNSFAEIGLFRIPQTLRRVAMRRNEDGQDPEVAAEAADLS